MGDIYSSAEELERTLDNITRKLNSQKIFQEINWEVSYWREDFPLLSRENLGAYITITVKDTLSLYLLPTVMYDSNLGMVYGGSFNYDNVLGTLTNLSLRGYGGTSTWRAGGTWEKVPLELFRGDFSLFCEQVRTQRVDDQDRTVLEYTNLLLDFNVRIDVPLDYGWSISIQPGAYLPFNYELVSWDPGYGRDEFDNLTPQTTGFLKWGGAYSNVYWEENFRRGIGGDVSLTWEGFLDEWKFEKSLDCSFSTFYRPLPFLGLGHHFSAFYVFDGIRDEAGLYIRGVLDHLMYGEWGLFLNNNVDIRAFAIPPVVGTALLSPV